MLELEIEIINLLSYHNRRKESELLYKTKFNQLEPAIRQRIKNGAVVKFGDEHEFQIDKFDKVIFRKTK